MLYHPVVLLTCNVVHAETGRGKAHRNRECEEGEQVIAWITREWQYRRYSRFPWCWRYSVTIDGVTTAIGTRLDEATSWAKRRGATCINRTWEKRHETRI